MAIRPIVKYPAPILKQRTVEVTTFDAELGTLLDDMVETMYAAKGIGLAAPQIGVSHRVAVIDVSDDRSSPIELVNPVITASSGKTPSEEGCLSIPEYREKITRAKTITLTACDRTGKPFELNADGLLAICAQHEIDHLDGILYIDRMSRLKLELFLKWYKKQGGFN